MKREMQKRCHERDDIQHMIDQMETDMPEVKAQMDLLELNIELPTSLNAPPIPPETWLERLGSWAIRPGWQLPQRLFSTLDTLAITRIPLLLGVLLTPAMFLLWWLERG